MGVRRVLNTLPSDVARAAESAQREHWGRVLAATLRLARDLDIAEEATADAFLLALQTWPDTGIPESVEAWLLTVARRRAVDRIRRLWCNNIGHRSRIPCPAGHHGRTIDQSKEAPCRIGRQREMPGDAAVEERMPAVRRAVQLAYALGHTAASGPDLRDDDLAARALHLATALHRARPRDRESAGLLALLLLSQARASSRVQATAIR